MRFKKMFILLTFVACWVFYVPQALAGVEVYVTGKIVQFDVPPVVDTASNRTLVPFRHIFEALGAEVWFDSRANAAFGKKGDLTIELPVNQKVAYKNNEHIQLDVATQVVNGRTMVPLRFISESLGCQVDAHNTPDGLRVDIAWLEPDLPEEVTLSNERTLTDITTTTSDTELIIELTVEDGLNKVFTLRGPDRLVLDLQNTTNRAAKEVNLEHPLVSAIRTGQLNSETTRVVLDLNRVVSYHFEKNNDSLLIKVSGELSSIADTITTDEPSGQPAHPVLVVDEQLIILDAGHGGRDIGATGVSGKYEKDLVLSITNQLKTALEDEGYKVILTRSDDTYVSLDERVAIADRTNAFAFVSIHANSTANPAIQGLEIFKYYGSDGRLAQHVLEGILERTGQNNRKVKEAGFYVIKNTLMPAILIETGFISNIQEEAFLWEPKNQADIVEGIVAGIMAYQGR
ncbi:N-acetylmuramoyl-L-alanine amidase AmiC precursor [Sporotomaculum syntrophicum]|uniref:N-acetylmuramoyl-L-alanine amidase AmiC n=1 Tax=Sporotomaculum syntrophicum TaxID=182264 RepID=A0A9D3AX92_9FIRM|nr:N-acetylmuramoyl-L-alanine amidase family protein [Sporotomaculum syntrophicum]KAF1084161.1 N-acetylmuramoyl-L-alanine amidase AmiC precursor [Sporotomaculum syntrophicum]